MIQNCPWETSFDELLLMPGITQKSSCLNSDHPKRSCYLLLLPTHFSDKDTHINSPLRGARKRDGEIIHSMAHWPKPGVQNSATVSHDGNNTDSVPEWSASDSRWARSCIKSRARTWKQRLWWRAGVGLFMLSPCPSSKCNQVFYKFSMSL